MMATNKRPDKRSSSGSEDLHDDDLSVFDLIEGPTAVLSPEELAVARTQAPAEQLEATRELSVVERPTAADQPAVVDEPTAILTPAAVEQAAAAHGGAVEQPAAILVVPPAEPQHVELPAVPKPGPLYRRALLRALPGLLRKKAPAASVPAVDFTVRGVGVDRAHLADYDRVCGFRLTDELPGTYPHVMGFPLTLQLITRPDFPIPLAGVVHVANRITVLRPIHADERLDFTVHAADLRPHDRGRQVDVHLTGSVDGEVVWRGVSTYLGKDRTATGTARRDPSERPAPPAASAQWRLDRRVGTDYARVSGDHNPIHTSWLGARVLGFPQPIAHGMWSKARSLAALAARLPGAYTVDVRFKLPVPLPSTVAFSTEQTDDGWSFALHSARSGKPHLAGTVTPPTE